MILTLYNLKRLTTKHVIVNLVHTNIVFFNSNFITSMLWTCIRLHLSNASIFLDTQLVKKLLHSLLLLSLLLRFLPVVDFLHLVFQYITYILEIFQTFNGLFRDSCHVFLAELDIHKGFEANRNMRRQKHLLEQCVALFRFFRLLHDYLAAPHHNLALIGRVLLSKSDLIALNGLNDLNLPINKLL